MPEPAQEIRHSDADSGVERDALLLENGKLKATIEALARSEGEPENTVLRAALAGIFVALGGRLPTKNTDAFAFALKRIELLTDEIDRLARERDTAREERQRIRAAVAGYDAQYSIRPIGEQHPELPSGAVERVEAVVQAARAAIS